MSNTTQQISEIAQATGLLQEDIEQVYGLSPLQQGMLLYSLRERKGMYISQGSIVQKEIDVAARQQAWQFMVARHAILRTSFHWKHFDEPVQIVHRNVSIPFSVLDWRHMPAREQHQRLRQFLQQDLEAGFDLSKPALFRHTIIRLTQNRWQVIDTHHHIILDGWSGRTLGAELAKVYRALTQGSTPSLPDVTPFRAYIDWINARDERHNEAFWRAELSGIRYPTPLPADKGVVQAGQRKPPKSWSIELTGEVLTALEQTAKDCQVSLNVLLVAAWAYLLSRYARQPSVVFGLLVSGRPPSLAGVESMVGMFLNTLPFRVTIEPDLPLADWLRGIQSHQNKLREYEHSPLMQVQRWSEVPAGVPLFESMISRHFDAQGASRKPAVKRTSKEKGSLSTFQQNYPLLWNFAVKDGLRMMLTYDVQRFETHDIARMVEQLRNVLVAMTERQQARVSALQMITPREQDLMLRQWGQGQAMPVHSAPISSIKELFEQSVRAFPDHTALWCMGQAFSYSELNSMANRVSHLLRSRAIGYGQIVIVYGSQSLETIAALLAVLKIGAAYLPLSVHCDRAMLAELARRPEFCAWLCEPGQADGLSALDLDPIEIELSCAGGAPEDEPQRDHPVDINLLSRVLVKPPRTSGAAIEYYGLTHAAALHRASVLPAEAPAQAQPGSTVIVQDVDGALFQDMLMACWMRGETLVLLGDTGLGESERLAEILAQATPQRVCMAPRQLRAILPATAEASPPLLEDVHILCCAEPLSADLAAQLRQVLPAARLDNLYGTLESGSAIQQRLPATTPLGGLTSIGTPLSETRVYILNDQGEPVAPGVPGELFLSSPGIATSLFDDTTSAAAAAPIQDPFDSDRPSRMVATGDIACWMSDGSVGLFGRSDQCRGGQGLPLAAGVVEDLLRQVSGIRDAVLVLHKEDAVLACLETCAAIDAKGVIADLVPVLPIGTQPDHVLVLERLPVDSSGRIDRRRLAENTLPASFEASETADQSHISELEHKILTVWQETLGLKTLSVHDNFFHIGGHSLAALRVISRLSACLEQNLSYQCLFEAPTIRGLGQWIEAHRKDDSRQEAIPATSTSRTGVDSVVEVPQSFSQQRLWFIAQLAPNSALYNAITVVHLESTLDAQALQQAVHELTTRHESLRTTFDTRDGEPVQRIHPPAPFHIEVIDISDLARHARRERLRSIRQAELAGPFDLEQGPIVRFTLVILDNAEQVLLACMHHIVTDGWSMGILRRELYTLYQAFRAGQPSPLPPLTLTYADYALWQRDWMKGEVLEQRLAYWRDQLAGAERLALRAERSGGKVPRYASSQVPVHLDADLTHRLHALAREEQATLFMLLLAAFQFVLGVNAGQDDVVVATPVANRPRAELENIIGFFVNTLVLRTNLSGGLTFRNLLQHVRRTCLDAYANQDLPFERLVDDLAPQRDINTQPLAQVLFVLQNAPSPAAHSDPQRRSRAGAIRKPGDQDPSGGGFIFFDMTLSLSETTDAIRGSLHFNTQLFDPERAERLAQHFVVAVQRLALEPDRQLSSVLLIDEREADQLRRLATGSDVRSDNQVCIHALFERCVDQGPQRTALLFESHRLTYAELDQRANRLAQVLIEAGIAREQVVGVYLERGHHAIIALLAVLKAGGVYLPLNPELPADRLRMMLDDAKVGYIVTEKALRTSLPVADDATRLIDPDEVAMQTGSVARPVARTTPKHLAYIIYTSGSTGRPKGVMIEHRSVALTIASQIPLFALSEDSRVLATIALSFDASLGEIFRTLCSGATLYLARAEQVLPGPELIGLLRRQRITTCTLVTSVLAALPREPLPDLTTLSVGGEALSADVVGFWGRGRRMLNGYGPTETAIGATMATNLHPGETPPLGRPLPHIRAYVVGVDRQLVPLGAPGELWLGGPAVARGYLARPELTAEYFITDPFSSVSGARLYRTGDRVRWRSDGQLEFLGRVDEQVKIRGYRIEPGEIAKVLERHREIGKAIVVARPGRTGDLRLVAYVVPRVEQDAANNAAQALVDEWQDASDVAAKTVQATLDDPRLNFSGWTSSYTGQPIPLMEMCQWADDTVKRILSLKPTKVLEIGCGSGLILFRLAPHCRRYVGIDFAAGLLAQIKRHLALVPPTCEVELVHRRANALDGLPEKTFDCVVINSVVQYFPNLDYLLEVLQGALQRVQPGGTLFLGDIRSLPLMQVFHASVQFAKAPATMGCEGLMQRVCRLTALERELLVDPRLFAKLVTAWERVTHVRILLKDGDADNELIRFRYDVIIQLDQPPKAASEIKWIDWRWDNPQEGRAVLEALLNAAHSPLGVRHIPNARTAQSTAMLALLKEANGGQTVADLRHQLDDLPSGIGPGFFAALAETVGYHWETSWQVAAADGRFDVLLWPQQGCAAAPKFPPVDTDALDWSALANDPALASKNRDLIPQLRDFLAEQLPGYMVPAAIVVLDALPLTTHGKIDRKALPDPDAQPGSQGPAQTYVPPTNETERILSGIWADLLQVEKVGIDDNFFELGGDSILSIRIIARANEAGLTLTTQDVYRFQTVREQASAATRSDIVTADQQRITGPLALTPIQHWFFEGDNPQPQHFNWATFIRLPPGLSDADLRHALTRLIEHHDALRMRFWQDEQGTWQAHVAASIEPIPLSKVTMASAGENARRQLMAEQAELAQRSLDLAQGPIFRLLWLDDGPQQRGTGLLIVHHLVVDAISMPILVNDLNRLLRQIKAKLSLELPLKTDSIKRWSETLLEQAQSEWLDAERHFWLAPYPDDIARLPVDHPGGVNTRLSEQEETLLLSPADTEQMVRKARALETGINELTIAALALGLAHFCSQPKVLINIERHGRENIGHSLNFARTLGWFANIAPALLEVPLEREPDQILQTLLRQLRHIPNKGIGYGILRYLGDAETQQRIREQPEAEVFFNFFGQQRKRHGQAAQSITGALEKGRLRSQSGSRRHLIEINAMIQQERLQLRCSYSTNLHEPQTLRRFADAFHTAVSRLFRD